MDNWAGVGIACLHVLGLFLADHDRVAQVEVHQRDHLVVRGLEERMRYVPAACSSEYVECSQGPDAKITQLASTLC